jgi:ferritin
MSLEEEDWPHGTLMQWFVKEQVREENILP